jgi:hypothetical protein
VRIKIVILNALLLTAPVAAQTRVDAERAVAGRGAIRSATEELRKLAASREHSENQQYRQRRDELRAVIHRTVDDFVGAIAVDSPPAAIENNLSTLLVDQIPERDYGDPPSARTVVTRGGTGLVLTYNVLGSRHDSTPTIRAYLSSGAQRYRLVATTSVDFAEGFTVHSRALRAPSPSEGWLMVWGHKEGFNGTLIRFRLYAFDGVELRTIWAPEGMLNARIAFRDNGFGITHLLKDRRPWQFVLDDFLLAADGPLLVGQRPVK